MRATMPDPVLDSYPDWWTNKDYAVLKAVEVFGTVRGRKALHKILYFANLKEHMFKYQWYKYGPYSPDLAPTIANHVSSESLRVEKDESGGNTITPLQSSFPVELKV